jgi:hypothetical protein
MAEQKLGRVGHDVTPLSRSMYVLAEVRATLACGIRCNADTDSGARRTTIR